MPGEFVNRPLFGRGDKRRRRDRPAARDAAPRATVIDSRRVDHRQGGRSEQRGIDEGGDFLRRPARLVAVRHVHFDADVLRRLLHVGMALHMAVEGIGEIVGAVDEEDRHTACREIGARVVPLRPTSRLV
jgi:hypothetical protein